MVIRPTHKELTNKIKQAVKAVSEDRIFILDPEIIAKDCLELGLQISDLSDFLIDAIPRLSPNDYIGHHPPEKSYEKRIKDFELFAFKAYSEMVGCNFYLKLALVEDFIWIVSLHEFETKGGKS